MQLSATCWSCLRRMETVEEPERSIVRDLDAAVDLAHPEFCTGVKGHADVEIRAVATGGR